MTSYTNEKPEDLVDSDDIANSPYECPLCSSAIVECAEWMGDGYTRCVCAHCFTEYMMHEEDYV